MSDLYDGRIAAWVQAWDHLEAAMKLQEKYPNQDTDAVVDRLHRAADIYAHLATVPPSVGIAGGTVLLERAEQERGRSNRIDDLLRKLNDEAEVGESA